jgi:3-oxoacyl-[acyl-carrier protein] reductase
MLQNKTVLITGARTGIGNAAVRLFAESGADVIAHMREQDDAFDLLARKIESLHGVKVGTVYFDMNDTEALRREIKALLKAKTQIDILVNNAGVSQGGLFQMTTMERTRAVFENNLFAHMEITQLVLRQMARRRSGAIVNVASLAGLEVSRGNTTSGVSKAAMIAWTRALALETADFLVRVNAVAPGLTDTKMATEVISASAEELKRRSFGGRYATPEEIAQAILFLASEEASYVNGAVLTVDGGGATKA